ncbi:MAG: hypothetical protein V1845_00905 [bacterium]
MRPYIGVTVTSGWETRQLLKMVPPGASRGLLLRAEVTKKNGSDFQTVREKSIRIETESLRDIFLFHGGINVIGLATEEPEMLCEQMLNLEKRVGRKHQLDGFELNIPPWPPIWELEGYKKNRQAQRLFLRLRIGKSASPDVSLQEHLSNLMGDLLSDYANLLDGVVFDFERDYGEMLGIKRASVYLEGLEGLPFGVSLAVNSDELADIEPLLGKFPNLSIDLGRSLKDEATGELNGELARAAINQALDLFDRRPERSWEQIPGAIEAVN